jgi:hypothetical protein
MFLKLQKLLGEKSQRGKEPFYNITKNNGVSSALKILDQ